MKEQLRQKILDAAVQLAIEQGYENVNRYDISKKARCSSSLIPYYFGSIKQLSNAIVIEGIRIGCKPIIAQALIRQHREAVMLPAEVKKAALSLYGL